MQRWKNILFNIILVLNCLLLLFVLAGDHLHIAAWLQVVGRMHPLVLHFPIVLLIIYIVWSVFLQAKAKNILQGPEDEIGNWLLLASALTSAITALMGFFLSREEGYKPEALWWHKWGGVAISLFSFCWYAYRNTIHRRRYMPQAAALVSFILIVFTGHQGSNITHGENYLLAPVTPEKTRPRVPLENAVVFADMVMPIFETKCMSCHSSKKAKGELIMETQALLLKGGKHGALWTAGQPEQSLLMQRIHLPEAEKKHMPPAGKPQLDNEEMGILFQWIKSGAGFKQKVSELPLTDSLRILAASMFGREEEPVYDFSAASDKTIAKLNNTNRLVHPLALGSPALAANFYNRQFYTAAALKELEAVKSQLVSLDLAYMPLKEEDVAVITQFAQLRKLSLNFSTVPGKAIAQLGKLPLLQQLSLSGTTVSKKDLEALGSFHGLKSVYLWNAPLSANDLASLRKNSPDLKFETGFMNDTLLLKLNAPILETEERIINGAPLAIKLKHYIKGVTIRYSTDGSLPDSINSPLYSPDLLLDKPGIFKARAFKKGWLGSDSVAANFYKNTYHPDSIRALTPLDSVYKGSAGAKTLVNAEKGDFNIRNGKWLGFRQNRMEMLLRYPEPIHVSSVSLSSILDIGGYIMPPVFIEVWGGNTEKSLVRLSRISPPQPDTIRPSMMRAYDCPIRPVNVRFLKIVAMPVPTLPKWHPGKGKKGWFFIDEIFVN